MINQVRATILWLLFFCLKKLFKIFPIRCHLFKRFFDSRVRKGYLPSISGKFQFYLIMYEREGGSSTLKRQRITVKEAASYLGVHTDTIYIMVKLNQIPHLKMRNRILFTKESIDLWLQDQTKTNLHS